MIGRRGFLAAALTAGCARRGSTPSVLEILVPNDLPSLDPRFPSDIHALRISRLVYATLTAPDPETLAPRAGLASIHDLGETSCILRLRDDAIFHDGRPVLAHDVVATLRALASERLGSPSRRIVSQFAAVEALDDRRVRVATAAPRATLLADLELPILPADEATRPRGAPLTGTGPLRLASMGSGAVALAPRGRPKDRGDHGRHEPSLVARTVRDEAARALRLVAGAADVAAGVLSPPVAFALPARPDAPAGLSSARRPGAGTALLIFQTTRAPLDRAEVRRAIAASIDRRAIVAAKLAGAAVLARGLVPPSIDLAPRDLPALAHDPAWARAVLASHGGRGARLVLVTSTDRLRVGIARAIAQSITDAGIPTEVRTFEFATFLARLSAGDFDLATSIAPEIADPDVLRWYLHGDALPPRGANRARFRDARIDQLLDRGLATTDREARRAIYGEVEAIAAREMPYLPLWHEDHVTVTSVRARGFSPSADGRWGALATMLPR